MDELLIRLSKSGVGCYVGTHFYEPLCSADDLSLICPTRRAMNIMMTICETFAHEYGLKFNPAKSKLITFNVNTDVSFMLDGNPITQADNAVHIGHHIGKGSNTNISSGVSNLVCSSNTMLTKFNYCSSNVKSYLFNTFCTSFYGCVLWSMHSTEIQRIYVTGRKIIRPLWSIPYTTHCNILPALMSSAPLKAALQIVSYLRKWLSLTSKINTKI